MCLPCVRSLLQRSRWLSTVFRTFFEHFSPPPTLTVFGFYKPTFGARNLPKPSVFRTHAVLKSNNHRLTQRGRAAIRWLKR